MFNVKKLLPFIFVLIFTSALLATVSSTDNKETWACNGSSTTFTYSDLPAFGSADFDVYLRDDVNGTQTTLTETTHYSIAATNNSWLGGSGTLTTVSAYAEDYTLVLNRNLDLTQTYDGKNKTTRGIETIFDQLILILQGHEEKLGRALLVPVSDSSSLDMTIPNSVDRAGGFLVFKDSSEPNIAGEAPEYTDFFLSIADDVNEAEMKATLNLEPGVDVQAWDAQLDDIAALALTNSNFIVGDGVNWVAESGETARTSMGAAGLTGNETIAGIKTFSSIPLLPASDPTTDNQATRKSYVDTAVEAGSSDAELTAIAALTSAANKIINFTGSGTAELLALSTFVRTTGTQTIAGAKTFSDIATLADSSQLATSAAPTSDADITNKKYVDDQIAANASALYQGVSNLDSEGNAMRKAHAYLAQVDGYVSAKSSIDDNEHLLGYIDDTNDPAGAGTVIQDEEADDQTSTKSIYFAVPAGWYFEIITDAVVATILWQSIGTDSKPIDQD